MKKHVIIALLATGLAASAPAAITAGLEAGYLTDSKDAYWAGRVGWEFKTSSTFSHQVELELGYTQDTETETVPAPLTVITFTGKTKLRPVTVNYRAETTAADKLGYYFGAGIGQARASISFAGSGVSTISDSDSAMALQAFTGIRYRVTPNATLQVGVKYLWIDDVELAGIKVDVGDDLALTAGLSLRF